MTVQPKPYLTEEAYLAFEASSPIKHEYVRGTIYAMTGGTEAHNLLASNTLSALLVQVRRRPCKVYNSDQRVNVTATGLYAYPDVTVVCGQALFSDKPRKTLINPTVIIEVLSPSTERYDRGMKFKQYRMIPTLQDYLLIAQDEYHIEHYTRQEHGEWLLREAIGPAAHLTLHSIECVLTLEDVYDKVEFEPETEA